MGHDRQHVRHIGLCSYEDISIHWNTGALHWMRHQNVPWKMSGKKNDYYLKIEIRKCMYHSVWKLLKKSHLLRAKRAMFSILAPKIYIIYILDFRRENSKKSGDFFKEFQTLCAPLKNNISSSGRFCNDKKTRCSLVPSLIIDLYKKISHNLGSCCYVAR